MNEPRFTFEENDLRSWSRYSFYDDRIEREWNAGFRKGKDSYPASEISGEFSEQTTFAFGLKATARALLIYLLIALVLHLGFDHQILRSIAFLFYGLVVLSAGVAITKLRHDTWVYVKRRDGRSLFCVRVKGLKEIKRSDLEREILRYKEEAHQPPQTESPTRRL